MPRHKPKRQSSQVADLKKQLAALQQLLTASGIAPPPPKASKPPKRQAAHAASSGQVNHGQVSPAEAAGNTTVGATRGEANSGHAKHGQAQKEWKTVPSTAKASPTGGDQLVAEGWSVPILDTSAADELNANSTGVLLLGMKKGKELLGQFRATRPLAMLLPVRVQDGDAGAPMSVFVRDKNGIEKVRHRVLYQLSVEAVTFQCQGEKVAVQADSSKVVLQVKESRVGKETWATVLHNPRVAARQWLAKITEVTALEVFPPTRLQARPDELQLVALLPATDIAKVLRKSGVKGVVARPFYTADLDRQKFGFVPLPSEVNLEGALAKANWLGDRAYGVHPCGKGWSIMVEAAEKEQLTRQLRPDDAEKFVGQRWEISGLPVNFGEASLKQLLPQWPYTHLFHFVVGTGARAMRTYVVRAATSPPRTKLQHTYGLALIKEYVQTPQPRVIERMKRGKGSGGTGKPTSTQPPLWEKSGVDVVRQSASQSVSAEGRGTKRPPSQHAPTERVATPPIAAPAVGSPATAAASGDTKSMQQLIDRMMQQQKDTMQQLQNHMQQQLKGMLDVAMKPIAEKVVGLEDLVQKLGREEGELTTTQMDRDEGDHSAPSVDPYMQQSNGRHRSRSR